MKILILGLLSLAVCLNALSISVVKRDATEDLLIQTEKLRKLAADEITKLKAGGKHEMAFGLEKLDKLVIDFETQLKGLNPQTAVGKGLLVVIEAGLKRVETAMEAEIKKLSGSFFDDDELAKILAKMEEEKKKMSGSDDLEALKKKIEEDMKKAMGGYYADDLKETMLVESEKLRKLATDEIAKLEAAGKSHLAAGLVRAEQTLIDLETQLKALNPQTEVGKALLAAVQAGVKRVETNIEAEIKKLSGSFFDDQTKDDLLAQTDKLKKLAAGEIEKLKTAGKHELAFGLEALEKILIDIDTQVHALNPQTAIGKSLLAIAEAGVKRVETAMEAEIKKLSGSFYDGEEDELAKMKAKLEEEKNKMGLTNPEIDKIRAKIEEDLKKMNGGFF